MALNREYTEVEYLTTVTDPNLRKALTMYRLGEHCLAIEKARRRQTWLSMLINSHIYWVKYHSVTSQQQDV